MPTDWNVILQYKYNQTVQISSKDEKNAIEINSWVELEEEEEEDDRKKKKKKKPNIRTNIKHTVNMKPVIIGTSTGAVAFVIAIVIYWLQRSNGDGGDNPKPTPTPEPMPELSDVVNETNDHEPDPESEVPKSSPKPPEISI